jgi:cytochrome c biogenesis protein CcmG/thiol:disulfide interchange protein DsbE
MKAFLLTPLIIFLLILLVMMAKLLQADSVPQSPLIGKTLPAFELQSIYDGKQSFKSSDLLGNYSLVNVFASWCISCKAEHPMLMKIKDAGKLQIYGIDWKDKREKVHEFLKEHGDPYTKIGADDDGKVILEFGVTGAPESFLISPEGVVLYRYAGVVTEQVFDEEILPLVK